MPALGSQLAQLLFSYYDGSITTKISNVNNTIALQHLKAMSIREGSLLTMSNALMVVSSAEAEASISEDAPSHMPAKAAMLLKRKEKQNKAHVLFNETRC
jgi:hypothetical protein